MITVPLDVRCNFCSKTFCCLQCRVGHETNEHQNEITNKIREEYLRSICHICRGEELPVQINQILSAELIQHISDQHLPLKCNKCKKVFENINDFQLIGKCCTITSPNYIATNCSGENMGENITSGKVKIDINGNEEALTPLTKINLRWRRKSKDFLHNKSQDVSHVKHEEPVPNAQLKRQTSTPMQPGSDSASSLSSMQFSSINCVSSSSETDLSPALIPLKPQVLSPKSNNKKKPISPVAKSRPKMAVQNTPLRQVMTKSIQRAMATHGHYKHMHLQQRKMTFDSSSSSNEPTASLMKLQVETEEFESDIQPLDLRLSPAIRRNKPGDKVVDEIKTESVEFEEIHVVLRRSESDSSFLTSYKSCYSDNGTPKFSSNNILKKTISFEASRDVEQTPAFLMPKKSFTELQTESETEIFYTPRSTPVRRVRSMDLTETVEYKKPSNSRRNIWNFVTSVVGSLVTGTKSDSNESPPVEHKTKWGFNIENPLKAAAHYFGKYSEERSDISSIRSSSDDDEEVPTQKRPRAIITSPLDSENTTNSVTSPTCKRRKIQGRKPIERMRKLA